MGGGVLRCGTGFTELSREIAPISLPARFALRGDDADGA